MPSSPAEQPASLPAVLAGPLLRRQEAGRLVLWLVGSRPLGLTLRLRQATADNATDGFVEYDPQCQVIAVGRHAFIHLIDLQLDADLPRDSWIEYDLLVDGEPGGIAEWAPHLLYEGARYPNFVVRSSIDHLLHGSCRKPHHCAADGLLCVDRLLADAKQPQQRPALLMMSGDQIYADDVAGPMLRVVHALIERLELFDEQLEGAVVEDSASLYTHPASYSARAILWRCQQASVYQQHRRQPPGDAGGGAGDVPAGLVADALDTCQTGHASARRRRTRALRQRATVDRRIRRRAGGVARAMAHLPCMMIFDDHDITDDWNLSANWEQTAYSHPFSKRIIGNALLAYLLCQGWGNNPDALNDLVQQVHRLSEQAVSKDNQLDSHAQNALIDQLLKFQQWHYVLPTSPALVVLDTRTRRWRSESNFNHPSGLLDWEALSELQQELIDHKSAIIVSPAPVFGVKLIEAIQRIFSWCGYPLLVDAENWMAHRGAANVILNIFRHSRTPGNYVILSGDVHYSFVYEILIRHRSGGPHIWQITSSGIKNEFPRRLLDTFDRLNRWLYSPRSPLNWFTKRRLMKVIPRTPEHSKAGERLWNSAGVGQVFFNEQGQPTLINQLNANGESPTCFVEPEEYGDERSGTDRSFLENNRETRDSHR